MAPSPSLRRNAIADKTQIANRALSKIGDTRISNISTDPSERAQIINSMYDQVRDWLLQSYPWNFAIARVQIAADATAPAWGFQKRYLLPTDFLHLLEVRYDPDYVIEDGYILTDEGAPIYIRYVKRVTESGTFPPSFSEALAAHIAVEITEKLAQSNTKKQILIQEREKTIKDAYANNAIQNPPQELRDDEWLLSRESSISQDDINYNA